MHLRAGTGSTKQEEDRLPLVYNVHSQRKALSFVTRSFVLAPQPLVIDIFKNTSQAAHTTNEADYIVPKASELQAKRRE